MLSELAYITDVKSAGYVSKQSAWIRLVADLRVPGWSPHHERIVALRLAERLDGHPIDVVPTLVREDHAEIFLRNLYTKDTQKDISEMYDLMSSVVGADADAHQRVRHICLKAREKLREWLADAAPHAVYALEKVEKLKQAAQSRDLPGTAWELLELAGYQASMGMIDGSLNQTISSRQLPDLLRAAKDIGEPKVEANAEGRTLTKEGETSRKAESAQDLDLTLPAKKSL